MGFIVKNGIYDFFKLKNKKEDIVSISDNDLCLNSAEIGTIVSTLDVDPVIKQEN